MDMITPYMITLTVYAKSCPFTTSTAQSSILDFPARTEHSEEEGSLHGYCINGAA